MLCCSTLSVCLSVSCWPLTCKRKVAESAQLTEGGLHDDQLMEHLAVCGRCNSDDSKTGQYVSTAANSVVNHKVIGQRSRLEGQLVAACSIDKDLSLHTACVTHFNVKGQRSELKAQEIPTDQHKLNTVWKTAYLVSHQAHRTSAKFYTMVVVVCMQRDMNEQVQTHVTATEKQQLVSSRSTLALETKLSISGYFNENFIINIAN